MSVDDPGGIRCPVFFAIVQTLLIRAAVTDWEDVSRGLELAATVPPTAGGVLGRYGDAAREFASWVVSGNLAADSTRKPAWWRD